MDGQVLFSSHSNVWGEVSPLHFQLIHRSAPLDNSKAHPSQTLTLPRWFPAYFQAFDISTNHKCSNRLDREHGQGTRTVTWAQEDIQAYLLPRIPGAGARLWGDGGKASHFQAWLPSRNSARLGDMQPMQPERSSGNNQLPAVLCTRGTTWLHIY